MTHFLLCRAAVYSFLLGALADRIGATNALIVAALFAIIPIVLYWRVLRPRAARLAGVRAGSEDEPAF